MLKLDTIQKKNFKKVIDDWAMWVLSLYGCPSLTDSVSEHVPGKTAMLCSKWYTVTVIVYMLYVCITVI